jgi:hypothetical protein
MTCQPRAASLLVLAAVPLALAGCFEASGNSAGTSVSAPPGGPNAATIAEPVQPVANSAASGPMTATRAREACWMEIENNKKAPSNLDQRAKMVDQCVSAKLNGAK